VKVLKKVSQSIKTRRT